MVSRNDVNFASDWDFSNQHSSAVGTCPNRSDFPGMGINTDTIVDKDNARQLRTQAKTQRTLTIVIVVGSISLSLLIAFALDRNRRMRARHRSDPQMVAIVSYNPSKKLNKPDMQGHLVLE